MFTPTNGVGPSTEKVRFFSFFYFLNFLYTIFLTFF